jgi:lipoprotein NlpI
MLRRFLVCSLLLLIGMATAVAAGYDDFARGLSANNRGDADQAITSFTVALKAGDLNSKLVPVAYVQRAIAYTRKAECALAVSDLTEAIKLRPDYLEAYGLRGYANECTGDGAAAVADYTQAITIKPNAEFYAVRGQARWSAGDFAGAVDDLAQGVKLVPKATYWVLWQAMAQTRAGTFDANGLADEISALDLDGWPDPVLDLYRGKSKPEDVARAAGVGDAKAVTGQRCEANFYTAEWWLAGHNEMAARPLLLDARANCPHDFVEYFFTNVELKRLK